MRYKTATPCLSRAVRLNIFQQSALLHNDSRGSLLTFITGVGPSTVVYLIQRTGLTVRALTETWKKQSGMYEKKKKVLAYVWTERDDVERETEIAVLLCLSPRLQPLTSTPPPQPCTSHTRVPPAPGARGRWPRGG